MEQIGLVILGAVISWVGMAIKDQLDEKRETRAYNRSRRASHLSERRKAHAALLAAASRYSVVSAEYVGLLIRSNELAAQGQENLDLEQRLLSELRTWLAAFSDVQARAFEVLLLDEDEEVRIAVRSFLDPIGIDTTDNALLETRLEGYENMVSSTHTLLEGSLAGAHELTDGSEEQ